MSSTAAELTRIKASTHKSAKTRPAMFLLLVTLTFDLLTTK